MIIGLTGGIGSGKSTVAQIFRDLKITVIDADQITKRLVAPGEAALDSIVSHFGPTILQPNGELNRAKLRSRIFESVEERRWLEKLLHPLVKADILKCATLISPGEYCVVEIPLLIESQFEGAVDRILVVDCLESQQIDRVAIRDAIPRSSIAAILRTQADRKTRLAMADDIISNDTTRDVLKQQVRTLHIYYSELAKNFSKAPAQ